MRTFGLTSILPLLFWLTQPLLSWGIDLQPNDVVAPQPDKNYLMVSYVNNQNTNYFKNGSAVSAAPYGSPVINSNAINLRGSRTYSIQELPAVTYLQLPYTTVQPAGSLAGYPADSGIGDLKLATAICRTQIARLEHTWELRAISLHQLAAIQINALLMSLRITTKAIYK